MADGVNLAKKLSRLDVEPELIRRAIERASEEEAEIKTEFFGEKTKRVYHKSFNRLSIHCYNEWLHVKAWDYRSSRSFSRAHVLSYNTLTGEIKYDTTDLRVDERIIQLATDFLREVLLDDKDNK